MFTKCIPKLFLYKSKPNSYIFVNSLPEQGETKVNENKLALMLDFTEFETFWALKNVTILTIYQPDNFVEFQAALETALLQVAWNDRFILFKLSEISGLV